MQFRGLVAQFVSEEPINTSFKLVSLGRFELPTPGLGILCSIHLSYRDTYCRSLSDTTKNSSKAGYFCQKHQSDRDIFIISLTRSSKDMPASSAAMGSRLVSVMPGEVFSSRT
jgi:hypothetical protein